MTSLTPTETDRRAPVEAPVLDVIAERWSPRAFADDVRLSREELASILEAARWSPSAYNAQPWRFVVTERGDEDNERLVSTLTDFNKAWAPTASVLILAVAELSNAETGREIPTAEYDLGQSVAYLSIQAQSMGMHVHQMSGFDPAAARETFALADNFKPVAVIAIGKRADASQLVAPYDERESAPRVRRPISESVLNR